MNRILEIWITAIKLFCCHESIFLYFLLLFNSLSQYSLIFYLKFQNADIDFRSNAFLYVMVINPNFEVCFKLSHCYRFLNYFSFSNSDSPRLLFIGNVIFHTFLMIFCSSIFVNSAKYASSCRSRSLYTFW